MKLRVLMMALLGVTAMIFAASDNIAAVADEVATDEVMKKVNGKEGLKLSIAKALQAKKVDWDALKMSSEELVKLAEAMAANKQEKGGDDSWAKLTKAYLNNAKAIDAAIMKKDTKLAFAAHSKAFAQATCGACHKVHKP